MNKEQLNNVSGGTVAELEELISAIYPGEEEYRHLATATSHVPVGSSALAALLEQDLMKIGIRSNISTGLAGTGIWSKENMYEEVATGQALTHREVINRLTGK